jgi:molybdopterin-guanine dinucleotide biosynthesis protein A
MDHNNILGVVLAGGQSKRFGADKSQVNLEGKILINYILSEIVDVFNEILIVANSDIEFMQSKKFPELKIFKRFRSFRRRSKCHEWIKQNNKIINGSQHFLQTLHFLKKNYLKIFMKKINFHESKLFFIKSNDTRHNIFGLWSLDLLSQLEEDLIKKGERKVELWANSIGVKNIDMQFKNNDPFFNINTKEDLENAKKYLKKHD